ncbi:UNVERIFIED_CONTAM: mitochondrial 37S ribosomal protein rsm10 [Siphonaria sp. JEL0065]|nr:mitochondrial 37S ribosomal protein rsm10 [Siphonaria sp. JEL0065]
MNCIFKRAFASTRGLLSSATNSNTPKAPYNMETFAIPTGSFNLPLLPDIPIAPTAPLSANLELESFMPDHVDFVAYYARHAALKRNIAAQKVIHLATQTKKWHVTKGPFVHDKSKEVFEQKTFRRLIQVFGTNEEVVREWYTHVNKNLPPGINMKIHTFNSLDPTTLTQQIALLEKEVEKEKVKAQKRLENTLGPDTVKDGVVGKELSYEEDVRARADAFIKKAMGGASGGAAAAKGKKGAAAPAEKKGKK